MRWLVRWSLNGLAVESLLLGVGVCVLWARSYAANDEFGRRFTGRRYRLVSSGGLVGVEVWQAPWLKPMPWHHVRNLNPPMPFPDPPRWWNWLGLDFGRDEGATVTFMGSTSTAFTASWLTVPYWSLAVPLMLFPLVRLALRRRARVRRHRVANARCPRCDYDLRASPHGCPECGAGATTAAATGVRS